MASPTATSAAATAMMKNTNTCASGSLCCAENATSKRLTAFNINSMHIKTMIALRRNKTPSTPMPKRIAQSVMYQFNGMICMADILVRSVECGVRRVSHFFYLCNHLILFLASITAPTIAAKNKTDESSKGTKKSLNKTVPSRLVNPMFASNGVFNAI